jgi:hypothetical protein
MKQRIAQKKDIRDMKVELHQHTKDGVPFGKAHPIDALHSNPVTKGQHNVTILSKMLAAKGSAIFMAQRDYKKYLQD